MRFRAGLCFALLAVTMWRGDAAGQSAGSVLRGALYGDSVHWSARAPGITDWIWSITVDHTGTVWVGTDIGGMYSSSDRGGSWQHRNNGLGNMYVTDIAVHPLDSMLVFAATYGGIYRSTNRGRSWSYVGPYAAPSQFAFTSIISSVAVDPRDTNRVYAGTGGDRGHVTDGEQGERGIVWASASRGDPGSWTRQVIADSLTISWLEVDPNEGWVWAATHDGFYRGFFYGTSWERRPVAASSNRLAFVAMAPSAPNVLYATARETTYRTEQIPPPPTTGGIFKSTSHGWSWWSTVTWQIPQERIHAHLGPDPDFITTDEYQNGADQFRWIAVHPTNPDIVFIGNMRWEGAGVYRTLDGGGNWENVTHTQCYPNAGANVVQGHVREGHTGCNESATAIAFDPTNPNRVYWASVNQIFRSENLGATWEQIYTDQMSSGWVGRGMSVFGGVMEIERNESTGALFVGHADASGGLQTSANGGLSWNRLSPPTWSRFSDIIVDPVTHYVYAVVQSDWNGVAWRLYRSQDHGAPGSWFPIHGLINRLPAPSTPFAGIHLAFDAQNRILYAAVGDDATAEDGTDDGVYRWRVDEIDDDGPNWTRLATVGAATNRHYSGIAVDPAMPSHLYLTIEADNNVVPGRVYRSIKSGATWTDITPNLGWGNGLFSATTLLVGPLSTLYVGSEAYGHYNEPEVFVRPAWSGTWSTLEMPTAPFCPEDSTAQIRALEYFDGGTQDVLLVGFSDNNYHDLWSGCGLWGSVNGGSFRRLDNAQLPTAFITALYYSPLSNELFVGVDGSGVFRATME